MIKKTNNTFTEIDSISVKVRYEKGGYLSEDDRKFGELKRELFLNMMAELIRKYGRQVLK